MTCIVGLVDSSTGSVTLGADSLASSGWSCATRVDAKVFRNGSMLFGVSGSPRMTQLLRYALVVPEHPPELDTMAYLVTTFINAVRDCLQTGGYAIKDKEQETHGSDFLLAYRGQLFRIQGDYQIAEYPTQYAATGSGMEVALGALYAIDYLDRAMPAHRKIRIALEASAEYDNGVRGPFIIETLAHETAEKDEAA